LKKNHLKLAVLFKEGVQELLEINAEMKLHHGKLEIMEMLLDVI